MPCVVGWQGRVVGHWESRGGALRECRRRAGKESPGHYTGVSQEEGVETKLLESRRTGSRVLATLLVTVKGAVGGGVGEDTRSSKP